MTGAQVGQAVDGQSAAYSSTRPARPCRASFATTRSCLIHCTHLTEVEVVAVVWHFETRPEHADEFERFYGADGEWTRLSRRSRSFLGSSFLKDLAAPDRYLLVEYWSEMLVYERHLTDVGVERKELETERDRFVVRMDPVGVYNALDVPERVGPTWSRRSG